MTETAEVSLQSFDETALQLFTYHPIRNHSLTCHISYRAQPLAVGFNQGLLE